ncbi:hypothetical protein [Streptomyces sp. NPDC060002]|uniref:hypothetical protein n=1 Tax=Streptomyces sp. NPDC060002 TaxID=3347033 RepID=UPI003686FDF8
MRTSASTSAPAPLAGGPVELVDYLCGRGRRKVLFGANYPMVTPAQALEHLDRLELDEEAGELFLAGNACRVFVL